MSKRGVFFVIAVNLLGTLPATVGRPGERPKFPRARGAL